MTDLGPRGQKVVRDLQSMALYMPAGWSRPVIVQPFPEPPWGTCSGCPDPGRCGREGCRGMDGVVLSDEELRQIG